MVSKVSKSIVRGLSIIQARTTLKGMTKRAIWMEDPTATDMERSSLSGERRGEGQLSFFDVLRLRLQSTSSEVESHLFERRTQHCLKARGQSATRGRICRRPKRGRRGLERTNVTCSLSNEENREKEGVRDHLLG